MSTAPAAASSNEFVDFWNDILVPKFTKYRHVLVGGLTHHSEAIFPKLEISPGDKAVDVGCGFGDTAIQIAERVGGALDAGGQMRLDPGAHRLLVTRDARQLDQFTQRIIHGVGGYSESRT